MEFDILIDGRWSLAQSTMTKRMEDIREECLEELVSKTFFHHMPDYYYSWIIAMFCKWVLLQVDDSNTNSIKESSMRYISNGLESKIRCAITDLLSKPKRLHVFYLNYFNLKFCLIVYHVALNDWATWHSFSFIFF